MTQEPFIDNPTEDTTSNQSSTQPNSTESFKVSGEDLLKRVKAIIKEGNVRRIIISNKEGKTILEIPVTIGIIGAAISPVLAAVGAIAALVTECTITVVRK